MMILGGGRVFCCNFEYRNYFDRTIPLLENVRRYLVAFSYPDYSKQQLAHVYQPTNWLFSSPEPVVSCLRGLETKGSEPLVRYKLSRVAQGTRMRPGQYLTHVESHITPALADSCLSLGASLLGSKSEATNQSAWSVWPMNRPRTLAPGIGSIQCLWEREPAYFT